MHQINSYLSGDTRCERLAVELLRTLGEQAAYRLGFQPFDADSAGVDFAAHILTKGAAGLRRHAGDWEAYLQRAATWHASKQLRAFQRFSAESLETVVEILRDENSQEQQAANLDHRQILSQVEALVAMMSPRDQELYRLYFVDELPSTELARRLSCSPAAIRKRAERIRSRFRSAGLGL